MRIGLFCNEYPPRPHGGIGTFTQMFARGLVAEGHAVSVVGVGQIAGERVDNGVRVVTLPRCRTIRGTTRLRNRWSLWRWFKTEVRAGRIDVFELPEFGGYLPFPFLACPVVVRLHLSRTLIGRMKGRPVSWKLRLLELATLRFHRHWIGVSAYILESTEREFGTRPSSSEVIYNPAPSCCPVSNGYSEVKAEPYVLFVGSVSERKGALVLARAARRFMAKHPHVKIVYVGGESNVGGRPISEVIRELAGELSSHFVLLGRRPHTETLDWIRNAAVVVLPSQLEAFSLVPLESMACGTPVIYTKACSGEEVIRDGVTGLLVDPKDPMDVADKVDLILSDRALAERLVCQARTDVEDRFSLDRCVRESVGFYRRLLHAGRGNG